MQLIFGPKIGKTELAFIPLSDFRHIFSATISSLILLVAIFTKIVLTPSIFGIWNHEIISPDQAGLIFSSGLGISFCAAWTFFMEILAITLVGLWGFSGYLEFDPDFAEFSWKLFIFIFSVWFCTSSSGFFLIILAWEIIGWISFRLIGHWNSRSLANLGTGSAIGFNRVGDIVAIFTFSGMTNLADFAHNNFAEWNLLIWLGFKSVVFSTFLWLPEAMEGPTPVSSLLHSATLVMAGIFSASRFLCFWSPFYLIVSLLGFSFCTILAISEKDLKRSVAFSTVILVGNLFSLLIISAWKVLFSISLIHGGYKALFFVISGRIIAVSANSSEQRALGISNIWFLLPIVVVISAFPGSTYFLAKHDLENFLIPISFESLGKLVHFSGIFLVWIFAIRLFSGAKSKNYQKSFVEFAPFFATIGLGLAFSTGKISSSDSSAQIFCNLVFIFLLNLVAFSMIFPNFSPMIFSISHFSVGVGKYGWPKFLSFLASKIVKQNSSSPETFGGLGILLVIFSG